MKKDIRKRLGFLLLVLLSLVMLSCEQIPVSPSQVATITGKIIEANSSRPVVGALVETIPASETTISDENGNFSISIELSDSSTSEIILRVSKQGFETHTSIALPVRNGDVTTFPDIRLSLAGSSGGASGVASNIVLVSIEASEIFVLGSGANVTSELIFEVRDKDGTPVDLDHRALIEFRIQGGPGGGVFLSADTATTDYGGRVRTTVHSGTAAGTLQIVATTNVNGTSITSAPVPISIHGGLPNVAHFSLAVERLNFAGIKIFGLENRLTAFVGDKYSNPVPPGTSVQFQSTGGIIEGSAVTDALGRASATLLSAAPIPQGVPEAPYVGFAKVTAQTVDENNQNVFSSVIVLFSGSTTIKNISPGTFNLGPNESVTISFQVSDENDNPLVAGTTITVATSLGEILGNTSVNLGDTQSREATKFSVTLINSTPPETGTAEAIVTIQVSSQNGNLEANIAGTMRAI